MVLVCCFRARELCVEKGYDLNSCYQTFLISIHRQNVWKFSIHIKRGKIMNGINVRNPAIFLDFSRTVTIDTISFCSRKKIISFLCIYYPHGEAEHVTEIA